MNKNVRRLARMIVGLAAAVGVAASLAACGGSAEAYPDDDPMYYTGQDPQPECHPDMDGPCDAGSGVGGENGGIGGAGGDDPAGAGATGGDDPSGAAGGSEGTSAGGGEAGGDVGTGQGGTAGGGAGGGQSGTHVGHPLTGSWRHDEDGTVIAFNADGTVVVDDPEWEELVAEMREMGAEIDMQWTATNTHFEIEVTLSWGGESESDVSRIEFRIDGNTMTTTEENHVETFTRVG